MIPDSAKADLHHQLRQARAALLWKLEGLSDYDVRRPLTPHGTNLLGLVKHLTGCEIGYFGAVFARPYPDPPSWLASAEPAVDMWAAADEQRWAIIDTYQRACAHADATITALPADHRGTVPTWPPQRRSVTLHQILVHMLAETARHAGHADIVRELIDQQGGLHRDQLALPSQTPDFWRTLHARIEDAARHASPSTATMTIRPMTDAEYRVATDIREAASIDALTPHMPFETAAERVRAATAALLPQGRLTYGHHLLVGVIDDGAVIGHAWLGPDPRQSISVATSAWLYDVHIYASWRGQGFGQALLSAVESLARTEGFEEIALNVNAGNVAARGLYRRAGYSETSQCLRKRLLG